METIKFRAFENENGRNRMFEWDEIKKDFNSWLNCKDTVVMQFTGLTDKNGKEIYSGDLIKSNYLTGHVKYHGCAFMIEWHDDVYADLLGWEDYKHGQLSNGTEYEVIGNIFENKDLINQ
jgi:uncharacterized phage protein (TIGR01671 family)